MSEYGHRDAERPRRAEVVAEGLLTVDRGAPAAGGAPRYRLRAALELFFASDGDVYLLRGGAGTEFVVRGPATADRELLRQLSAGSIEVVDGSEAASRLRPLIEAGVVVPEPDVGALQGSDAERFVRQLPYLEDFGDPIAGQQKLRDSTVAILGCGGLGTWSLGALASAGVGRFVLVDDDTVDLTNLNRQILYTVGDIGRAKTDCAAEWLRAFDPTAAADIRRVRISGPADLADLDGCDALLLTADWPPYELARWVDHFAFTKGVPFITAGQQPPMVKIGPAYVPGRTACLTCHEAQLRRRYALYDELAQQRQRQPTAATTLGPASALVGSLVALEVMHLLLGHRPLATEGRSVVIDIRTLGFSWEQVEDDPACERCRYRDAGRAAEASGV